MKNIVSMVIKEFFLIFTVYMGCGSFNYFMFQVISRQKSLLKIYATHCLNFI